MNQLLKIALFPELIKCVNRSFNRDKKLAAFSIYLLNCSERCWFLMADSRWHLADS